MAKGATASKGRQPAVEEARGNRNNNVDGNKVQGQLYFATRTMTRKTSAGATCNGTLGEWRSTPNLAMGLVRNAQLFWWLWNLFWCVIVHCSAERAVKPPVGTISQEECTARVFSVEL